MEKYRVMMFWSDGALIALRTKSKVYCSKAAKAAPVYTQHFYQM